MRKALLGCGALASVLYVAANVVAPVLYEGYDWVSQTVSELSAIGAPTRPLWVALMVPYTLLMMAFGGGIWISAGSSRALRAAAMFTLAHAVIGFFWPPMNQRGAEMALTDWLHIAWTAITVPLMLLQIVFAAAGLGRRFRVCSGITVAAMILFAALTAIDAPNIAAGVPTPLIGVWERIGIAAYMIWIPVLAITLARRPTPVIH